MVFAQWLHKNNIRYQFVDMCNLTEMALDAKYKVKLCYKYVLSLSDIHMMTLNKGDMVVNLHSWNDAPISEDAHNYALDIGVQLFSQSDFFRFAHRNIR